jgi:hypothetical protein
MAKGFESVNTGGSKSETIDNSMSKYDAGEVVGIPKATTMEVDMDTLSPEEKAVFGFAPTPTEGRPSSIGEMKPGTIDRILNSDPKDNIDLVKKDAIRQHRAVGFGTFEEEKRIPTTVPGDLREAEVEGYIPNELKSRKDAVVSKYVSVEVRNGNRNYSMGITDADRKMMGIPPRGASAKPQKKSFWKRMFGG